MTPKQEHAKTGLNKRHDHTLDGHKQKRTEHRMSTEPLPPALDRLVRTAIADESIDTRLETAAMIRRMVVGLSTDDPVSRSMKRHIDVAVALLEAA